VCICDSGIAWWCLLSSECCLLFAPHKHIINSLCICHVVLHNLKTRFLDSNIIYTYCGEQCLHNNVFINQGGGFVLKEKWMLVHTFLLHLLAIPHVHNTYLLLIALGCLLLLALGCFSLDASVLPTLGHNKQLLLANQNSMFCTEPTKTHYDVQPSCIVKDNEYSFYNGPFW